MCQLEPPSGVWYVSLEESAVGALGAHTRDHDGNRPPAPCLAASASLTKEAVHVC